MNRVINVKFRQKAFKIRGLKNANQILSKHMRGGLSGIGRRLKATAPRFMRKDQGTAQRSLQIKTTGTFENARVEVFSTIIQAIIDAYGLRRGVHAPYAPGSRLYRWASRKLDGRVSRTVNPAAGPVSPNPLRRAGGRVVRVKRVSRVINTTARVSRTAKERSILIFARRVARMIYLKGIKPTHWNERALEANKGHILNDLRNALRRAANEMSHGG